MMLNHGLETRLYWVETLDKIARPVLANMAEGRLRERMPVETQAGNEADRFAVTHLEALGRTLAGIAPWLELEGLTGEEERRRAEFAELARLAISHATDPNSPDFCNWAIGGQPLVDGAFLAHGLLRAPRELWHKLDADVQERVVECLIGTRGIKPHFSNWLLFSAIIEAFLMQLGKGDTMRIDFALVQHEAWYKGDGAYGDGPKFHWDYYNSYVIQPMLIDIVASTTEIVNYWRHMQPEILRRAQRFAAVQERLIASDGTFPVIGRSIAYRCGAFQLLAQVALQKFLPASITPSQVRGALTAVIKRTLEPEGTFDENNWLRIGLCGSQPSLGESYISTGSLYLCLAVFLPLGLSPDDEFWTESPQAWSSQQIWGGQDKGADKAI
jgi:hypothetical protein